MEEEPEAAPVPLAEAESDPFVPLAEVESEPFAPQEEFAAPVAPEPAAADAEEMPDFVLGAPEHDAPAQPGGDDDMEDFFQDLGFK